PKEAQAEQLQALESKGTAHGKHFSLKELTDALQVYEDNASKWNYDQRAIDHWCKKVGGAQMRLPAHVVNEYCRADRAFGPCPSEWESKLPRTQEVLDTWDGTQSKYVKGSWFISPCAKDGLGLTYAFLRYTSWGGAYTSRLFCGVVECAHVDLNALQSLWKTRTEQLELLVHQLSAPSLVAGRTTGKVEPTTFSI
ncbi:MAG: hypothetical protein JSR33_02060, partial [Proteobacteria bacterium]|nr:hypothetical protein [Pseudomonadota bacterium]